MPADRQQALADQAAVAQSDDGAYPKIIVTRPDNALPASATSEPHLPATPANVVQDVAEAGDEEAAELEADCPLPSLPCLQWERRSDRPGLVAQHAPAGVLAPRRTKTYLGYVNKELLASWLALPEAQRRAVIDQWVAARRAQKGIG